MVKKHVTIPQYLTTTLDSKKLLSEYAGNTTAHDAIKQNLNITALPPTNFIKNNNYLASQGCNWKSYIQDYTFKNKVDSMLGYNSYGYSTLVAFGYNTSKTYTTTYTGWTASQRIYSWVNPYSKAVTLIKNSNSSGQISVATSQAGDFFIRVSPASESIGWVFPNSSYWYKQFANITSGHCQTFIPFNNIYVPTGYRVQFALPQHYYNGHPITYYAFQDKA